jgi:predicted RND superfamily exporter protein
VTNQTRHIVRFGAILLLGVIVAGLCAMLMVVVTR